MMKILKNIINDELTFFGSIHIALKFRLRLFVKNDSIKFRDIFVKIVCSVLKNARH